MIICVGWLAGLLAEHRDRMACRVASGGGGTKLLPAKLPSLSLPPVRTGGGSLPPLSTIPGGGGATGALAPADVLASPAPASVVPSDLDHQENPAEVEAAEVASADSARGAQEEPPKIARYEFHVAFCHIETQSALVFVTFVVVSFVHLNSQFDVCNSANQEAAHGAGSTSLETNEAATRSVEAQNAAAARDPNSKACVIL